MVRKIVHTGFIGLPDWLIMILKNMEISI
jgi:hypothetical protein